MEVVLKNRDLVKYISSFQQGKKLRNWSWEKIIQRGYSQLLIEKEKSEGKPKLSYLHLYLSIESGNIDIVSWVVSHTTDLYRKVMIPIRHLTQLQSLFVVDFACAHKRSNIQIVKLLVEAGFFATPEAVNCAARNGDLEVVKYLLDRIEKFTEKAIISALENGDYHMASYFLQEIDKSLDLPNIINSAWLQ